jgi:hypothetical protein
MFHPECAKQLRQRRTWLLLLLLLFWLLLLLLLAPVDEIEALVYRAQGLLDPLNPLNGIGLLADELAEASNGMRDEEPNSEQPTQHHC